MNSNLPPSFPYKNHPSKSDFDKKFDSHFTTVKRASIVIGIFALALLAGMIVVGIHFLGKVW